MNIPLKNFEAALLRLLVQGMLENTLIHCLFDEQSEGGDFTDAKDIRWQFTKLLGEDKSICFEIISST